MVNSHDDDAIGYFSACIAERYVGEFLQKDYK